MNRLAFLVALVMPMIGHAACDRTDRIAVYKGRAVPVYASSSQYAEVKFPESLRGLLPEQAHGVSIHEGSFPDRLFISTKEDGKLYNAQVIVQSASGESYRLQVIERDGCADGTVTIVDKAPALDNRVPNRPDRGEPGSRRLIKYMVRGETPDGYQITTATGSPQQRLVLEQGSVAFYLERIWRGSGDTGLVLLAVNRGRTPFRVAIDNIEFSSRKMISAFGHVREITMMPSDFRLDPAPEFAADEAHANNKGLIYLVANSHRRLGDGAR